MPGEPRTEALRTRLARTREMPSLAAYDDLVVDALGAIEDEAASPVPAPTLDVEARCDFNCDACREWAALTEAERRAVDAAALGSPVSLERLADILRDKYEDEIGEMADELWLADAREIAAALASDQ